MMSDRGTNAIARFRVAVVSGYPAVHAGLSVLLSRDPAIEVVELENDLSIITIDAIVVDHAGLDTALELARELRAEAEEKAAGIYVVAPFRRPLGVLELLE